MRKSIALMLLVAGCATGEQQRDSSGVDTTPPLASCCGYAKQKRICFVVTRKDFLSAPKWDAKQGCPPLSPRDADKRATEKFHALLQDIPVLKDTTDWKRDSITLQDHEDGYWVYVVHFRGSYGPGPSFFSPDLDIPVLMDGRIVSPEISDAP